LKPEELLAAGASRRSKPKGKEKEEER
jgi:hypothetical protein